ncbi:ABC transporter ATP-binding protein [Halorhodospira abdelmalekii]|nr:ABC transporter ATP-binding protein [Halorhodospira abdelmalekii]
MTTQKTEKTQASEKAQAPQKNQKIQQKPQQKPQQTGSAQRSRTARATKSSVSAEPTTAPAPLLELHQVRCCYCDVVAVTNLSFTLEPGRIACLLGPSGCGKTTTLRTIAGFEPLCQGVVRLRNEVISAPGYTLPPERRRMSMVFQDYALFPHLNIQRNITFGLRRMSRRERDRRADELLELIDLDGYGKRYPHELSGGQQQRVALARAVAPRPDLVLLDEPFSNLDTELRERLSRQFQEIFRHQGVSAILVTHDQHEAFAMADEIGLMRNGELVQWDTPYNLYHHPKHPFVGDFIGFGSMIDGTVFDAERVRTEVGMLHGTPDEIPWPRGTALEVLVRPYEVKMGVAPAAFHGRVIKKAFRGLDSLYTLRLPSGHELLAFAPSTHDYKIGSEVGLKLQPTRIVAFAKTEQPTGCCRAEEGEVTAAAPLPEAAYG